MWHLRDLLPRHWRRQPIPIAVHRTGSQRRDPVRSPSREARALAHLGEMFEPWFEPAGSPAPAVDLRETSGALEIDIELPGLDAKDIELTIDDGWLSVRGERRETSEGDEHGTHWREIRYGAFQRSVPLPGGVDVDAGEASLARGVLHIRLPRSVDEKTRTRSVPILPG